jgi:hypothetical protein
MSENWANIAKEVEAVVSDLGSVGTLFRQTSGGPTAPHLVGTFTKDTVGSPITFFPSSFSFKDGAYFKTQPGDLAALIPAAYSPAVGDRISIAGEKWKVEGLNVLSPQGTVVMYKAQLRKA